jgi:hypothetical protein
MTTRLTRLNPAKPSSTKNANSAASIGKSSHLPWANKRQSANRQVGKGLLEWLSATTENGSDWRIAIGDWSNGSE